MEEEAPAPSPSPEEVIFVEPSSMKDQTHIVKGKRTKRQRVQSPNPIDLTPTTDSSSGDKDNANSCEYECQDGLIEEDVDLDMDMDMANCLILLAQGQSRISPYNEDQHHHHHHHLGGYKFNSKKLIKTATNGARKAGYYVYECKTCNRTFPSFQALGGHRASHMKPNNKSSSIAATAAGGEKKQSLSSSDEELDRHYKNISSLSLQFSHKTRNLYNKKVHECSVCGTEFTSGQALGGHMRRHRPSNTTAGINNTSLTLNSRTTMTLELESEQVKQPRQVLSLDLDLNLAPSSTPEDNNQNAKSKFPFASKKQQQQQQQQSPNIVFSTAAMVDCHY